jgi:hypothetical protein
MDIYQTLNEIKRNQVEDREILLKILARQKNGSYDLEATVCPKEARVLLKCSSRKEQSLRSKGILPFTKVGRMVYIKVSDIQALISNGYPK